MKDLRLALIPYIRYQLCKQLTFPEAVQLRDALKLEDLKCPITFEDPITQKEVILQGVNSETILAYSLISKYGLDWALIFAIDSGNLQTVSILLRAGADVQIIGQLGQSDQSDQSALKKVLTNEYFEIKELLKKYKAC